MSKLFVALQLYTVRDFTETDVAGTLRKVKAMGYDYVELAGTYGMGFAEFKALLDEIGLNAISAHVQYDDLRANMEETIASYKSLGCKYVIIPMMQNDVLPGGKNCSKEFFVQFCYACIQEDVIPAYHNHAHEFERLSSGEFILDKLFADVPALFAEIDTGWVTAAGLCPEEYIKKYTGRCCVVHLKDNAKNADGKYEDRPVGKGSQNMAGIINAAVAAGAAGFVAELDRAVGLSSLDAAKESREYLKSLGY
ncbi:MAG: sugar phosphate isomerase/epimerase [Defluviitaleaceae bacterium]|nr:sugar phosphate isomerase/epimerase [Defluviitaleaceae bacterium]